MSSYAFAYCDNLSTVNIEEGFSGNIPKGMFKKCTNLVEIRIPKDAKYISYDAFDDCSRLTTIIVEGNNTLLYSGSG